MLADTNILIYAINADSPKHKAAQTFLKENLQDIDIAHQNVLEAIRVLTHPKFPRPMKLKDAQRAILAIAEVCRIISPNQNTYYLTLELIKEYQLSGNRIFDAYLVATALTNDINTVATDNVKDVEKFPQIRVYNPFLV